MKKEREKKKINIENTPNTERNWFSLVSIRSRVIEKSKMFKEVFSYMKNNKRGDEGDSKKESELCKKGKRCKKIHNF